MDPTGTQRTLRKQPRAYPLRCKMATKKNSLVANINRKKKSGTSKAKKDSTVDAHAYADMQKGWPKAEKKKK